MNTRRLYVLIPAILSFVLVGGCGNDPAHPATDGGTGYYGVSDVNVNGKMVTCVRWKAGYAGGLSCDFDHPH